MVAVARVQLAVLLGLGMQLAATAAAPAHVLEIADRVLIPEEGLLLGNGDLSVSAYQTADGLVWRLGKGDVWDRRLDLSDDPKPARIEEIARGIQEEGWKCGPYGGPVEATRGTKNPARMEELCQGSPPSYKQRPYPCPKPVGELTMRLPPDLQGMTLRQSLRIEEGCLDIACAWPSGVKVQVRCFIPPSPNVLVVHWKLENWSPETLLGKRAPVWFELHRWADPSIQAFAAAFAAQSQHDGFRRYADPKATPLPPPSVGKEGGLAWIEQRFPPDLLFADGFRCLMVPLGAKVAVWPVDMSPAGEARLRITPPSGEREGWLAVAVPTSSDAGGAQAELRRIRTEFQRQPNATCARWADENRKAAEQFWSQSRVHIADPVLENLWYETLHARRCAYRRGKTPPGLFLPSTVQDYSHWHGDYHTNYNFQEPFWGDYTANHLDVGDAYFDGIRFMLPIGRKIARDYYHCRGVFIQLSMFPIEPADDPLGTVPMGRMAYMTGWAMNQYWWRYLYTLDRDWLRSVGYPVMRDCALFYTDFLRKGADGQYHAFPSNQGEDGFSGDPKPYTDRPQIMCHARYCLQSTIRASEVLNVDEELRAAWRDRLAHMAGDDGRRPPVLTGLERLCAEWNPPEFGQGRPYRPQPDTHDGQPWPSKQAGVWTWYFGFYPWNAMGRLRSGSFIAERDVPAFRELIGRWRRPNGVLWAMSTADYGRGGAWTESLGVIAPLQEMMLQSWDGALRVFPAWPKTLEARYERLRAEGAFLVTAAWSKGKVTQLEILSERGSPCAVYAPWPDGFQVHDNTGQVVAVTRDPFGRPVFPTTAGRRYILQPSAQRMTVTSCTPALGSEYPPGTMRITYTSALDGAEDWALFLPGDPRRNTIVYWHDCFASMLKLVAHKAVRHIVYERECAP